MYGDRTGYFYRNWISLNAVKKAALLLALATPTEIWAGIELSKSNYLVGLPLMFGAIAALYFGTIVFSCGISREVEDEIDREFGPKE
jgi:hypothetical protein